MKDEGKSRARGRVIGSFLKVLCLAAIFIGIGGYLISQRDVMEVTDRMVTITKICILWGLFLIFMDCVYVLPRLFKKDVFAEESVMRKRLEQYLPAGESLEAGIYANMLESYVNIVYKKCRLENRKLVRDEAADVFSMERRKYSEHTVYVGMTQSSLLVVECEINKHYYEYDTKVTIPDEMISELPEDMDEREVGIRYALDEIADCQVSNGKKGNRLCTITMKNGSYFKLRIADNAGPTSDMPNHSAYTEKMLERM